jgi:hypothetical protein
MLALHNLLSALGDFNAIDKSFQISMSNRPSTSVTEIMTLEVRAGRIFLRKTGARQPCDSHILAWTGMFFKLAGK